MSENEQNIPIDQVNVNQAAQVREKLNKDRIEQYSAALDYLPPVTVYYEANRKIYHLADGHHRYWAFIKGEAEYLPAIVHQGTLHDAKAAAIRANVDHDTAGLPRSRADIERSVRLLLSDQEYGNRSYLEIAEMAGVSDDYVRQVESKWAKPKKKETKPARSSIHEPDPDRYADQDSGGEEEERPEQDEGQRDEGEHDEDDGEEEEPEPDTPQVLQKARAQAKELNRLDKEFQKLKLETEELVASTSLGKHFRAKQFDAAVKQVRDAIRATRPYATCPYCDGRGECKACKNAGWMPKDIYEAVFEDVKV